MLAIVGVMLLRLLLLLLFRLGNNVLLALDGNTGRDGRAALRVTIDRLRSSPRPTSLASIILSMDKKRRQ